MHAVVTHRERRRPFLFPVILRLTILGFITILVAAFVHVVFARHLGAQTVVRTYGFVYAVGNDTVGVERITVQDDRWSGDVVMRGQGRVLWNAQRVSPGHLGPVEFHTYRNTQDTVPVQTVTLALAGDSVHLTMTIPAGAPSTIASKPGAFILLNTSVAMLELMVERARPGGNATYPVFLASGGSTINVTVRRTADNAVVELAGQVTAISLNASGQMRNGYTAAQNLRFTRVEGAALSRIAIGAPNYDAPPAAPYTAQHVRIPTPAGHELAATLTRPRGAEDRPPVVVTITGSGAQDRDEFISLVRGYKPFRQVADTLGRNGVAVLRYDDRGYGSSTGNFATATSADFADDVRAVVAWLRKRDDIDPARIFLLGHSEGGLIAPMVAATDPQLAGIVTLAGPAQNGRAIIAYQQRYAIDRDTALKTARARDSAAARASVQFDSLAQNSAWAKFFGVYDPLATARKVRVPTLILQGRNDRQVTFEQANALGEAIREGGNSDVTVRVMPGLNHLFLPDADGSPANYTRLPNGHIGPEVMGLIVGWVKAHGKRELVPLTPQTLSTPRQPRLSASPHPLSR